MIDRSIGPNERGVNAGSQTDGSGITPATVDCAEWRVGAFVERRIAMGVDDYMDREAGAIAAATAAAISPR